MPVTPLAELARLIVPVSCPSCGRLDVPWCPGCASPFLSGPTSGPMRVEDRVPRLDRLDGRPPLPVWAISSYDGPTRALIVHWKDGGRADLDKLFAPAAARVVQHLAADARPQPLLIVPAPSNPASQRTRGRAHLDPIVRAVASSLQKCGWPDVHRAAILRRRRRLGDHDQVGLGARARGANAPVIVQRRAVDRMAVADRALALLIDDVVTTGATLASAELALEKSRISVLGAIVLAATAPPGGAADSVPVIAPVR